MIRHNVEATFAAGFMLAMTLAFIFIPFSSGAADHAPKKFRDSWDGNDTRYWSVYMDYTDGSITAKILVYAKDYAYVDGSPSIKYDAYLDYAHLRYTTTDPTKFTNYYYIDYDGSTKSQVVSQTGYPTSETYSTEGNDSYLTIKLFLTNANLNISSINIDGSWDVEGPFKTDGVSSTKNISITKMSAVNNPTYEFLNSTSNGVNQPKVRISYTKTQLNDVDNQSRIRLVNTVSGNETQNDYQASTGSYNDVAPGRSDSTYYWKQTAYNGNISITSGNITVPAFTLPKTATVIYDTIAHAVTFTWTIDPVTTTNLVKDRFKIQQADNSFFTDAREIPFDYDPARPSYSYTVSTNLSQHMYFRVARDHTGPNWSTWDFYQAADTIIPFISTNPASVKLTLQGDNTALLQWTPLQKAWVPGSSFVITRINNTSRTESAIKLGKADYDLGSYTDKQIAVCNEYTYTLQIIPPDNAGFTAFAPIQIAKTVLPTKIGTIAGLIASKGYFPDRTELQWTSVGAFDNFIVKRAEYGSTNYIQLATVAGSSSGQFQTDDIKGTPGSYYTYMIVGVVNCNNTPVYSKDTLYAIGFRSPTGNIYGRVTYENGQAVENVAVRLQNSNNTQMGKSVFLDSSSVSYLKLDTLHVKFADSAFTIETWIKPTDTSPKNQVVFSRGDQYELGFNAGGQVYFTYKTKTLTGPYLNPNQTFIHLAGIHSRDSLRIMINDSVIARTDLVDKPGVAPDKAVYIGRNARGNNFKGYIDEMRAWNIALDIPQIRRDYTRMLAGNENGLVAYWRFDEKILNQFYDVSHNNVVYNQNDGAIAATYDVHSTVIPTAEQLSLKGYTDSTGNYFISGVVFTGTGTTYTIVPLLGTHQFDPTAVNRLVSASSTEFTVDFKDKSSFAVSGTVYYFNSTVPSAGVRFKIDGQYAQKSNGDVIETDETGKFTVYVPVGSHEVLAFKNNHVFANYGKITDLAGNKLNYQAPVGPLILYDSTSIRFIGRVAGGAVEEAYPLGHSLSSNNLGKQLSISMSLPTGTRYNLHSGNDSAVIIQHRLPSDPGASRTPHKTRVVYSTNAITIYPDSLTGEFAADLIPEKFNVDNVTATGWNNILVNGTPLTVNFTDKLSVQQSTYNYTDSVKDAAGKWKYTQYADTVNYNDSYKFIKRVTPSVSFTQLDDGGTALPYFGNLLYESVSATGKKDTIPVTDVNKPGQAAYLFGNPVFKQNQAYRFKLFAYEEYPFYASVKPDGTPVIAQKNGKDVISAVPTQDGKVSILNNIRIGATQADTMSLSSSGTALYDFIAGDPDIAAPGLKSFSASVQFGQATFVDWAWFGNKQMKVYVTGGKLTGTDFITAGPDNLLMVLRDPPGSRSYSYAEKGTTKTTTNTYTGAVEQTGDQDLEVDIGEKLVTFEGLGFGVISTPIDITDKSGLGIHHEEHYTYNQTKAVTTTLTTRYQTSDASYFVGAPGDLFVGYSTNITYGESINVTLIKRIDLKAADRVIFDPGASSNYLVVSRSGINIGENFGTMFAYPQQHIEKVLIPNLKYIRNTLLLPPTTSSTDAQNTANFGKNPVYVSKLQADDINFGKSNNDTLAFGSAAKNDPFNDGKSYKIYFPNTMYYRTDSIMTLNQYIDNWIKRMADNEKAKLNSTLIQNYSFHAGGPIEYTEQTSNDTTTTNSFNFVLSGSVTHTTDLKLFGNGFVYKITETLGTAQGGETGVTNSTSKTLGFVLASDGTDDYFSVDVNKATDGNFAFRTKGGVSACPYEGATYTKYYQPKTVLDQPTQRIEVPVLDVDKAVVSDIPSTHKAAYTLTLRNQSEAKLPATFILGYVDNDSIKGATIAIDGTPIGGTGRAVVVQYGETVTKVLTLTKGPNAMDYNNIMILLHSSCQYDPTSYQETIGDTVLISAHFIPSCSDIHIKSPADNWVLNTGSAVDPQNKRYLPVTIDQFDVTNSLFHHIELQTKSSSSGAWTTKMKFYADSAKFNAAQGDKVFITNAAGIMYNLVMDDASFSDQHIDIQAVSVCELGPGNQVTTQSNIVSGIKDTYAPRLFGSPQPANGILGVSDNIRLNFNETIAAGLLTTGNFTVTGIRNGVQGDHSVSVKLDGISNYLATEFDKNLTGKKITAEMWILPARLANGTLISHGTPSNSMEMAMTADNHLEVTIGKTTVRSDKTLDYKAGEWAHVAFVYDYSVPSVSAYYNFTEVIHNAVVPRYEGTGHFEFGRSISKQGNYFAGQLHEARIWTDAITAINLQLNSLKKLSGSEHGLMAYYPMNEGKGTICNDLAQSSQAKLAGSWATPAGKAIELAGNSYVRMSTAAAPVTADMDYTIELWFKAPTKQTDAALVSNGRGDGNEAGGSKDLFFLGFESGLLTFQNNSFKIQATGDYMDNSWHHVALAVNRVSGIAQIYIDGLLNKYFDSKNLGGIAAAYTYLGARAWHNTDSVTVTRFDRYFKGNIDEFRIWNTYLNQTIISNRNNTRLKGNEVGLLAYYPFEKYYVFQNRAQMDSTLQDQKIQEDARVVIPYAMNINTKLTDETAPIKDRGPVDNLLFDFVVNNDALIINLLEPKQAVEKTIVTLTANNVRDQNGNKIVSPISWTAYIDQNQLRWSDDQLTLSKDVYAPMQFESSLINSGGSIQHFRLDNMPAWLTAVPSSGNIDPKANQKITFTVNEGLNVGTYDEIVYMRNDNNESEALPLTMTVKGKQPDWKVNAASFRYNMNIYGKMRINNVYSSSKEDILAAFYKGRCVGVAHNTYYAGNDLWYAFLTVYGDSIQSGNLEFRIWEAGSGRTFQATPSQAVSFRNDAVLGTSTNPVIFDGGDVLFQDISLNQNWNWISVNVSLPTASGVQTNLKNGSWSAGDIIKNEELGFDQYSKNAGWVGYLTGINNTSLFMLKTAQAQTLSISGTAVDVKKTPVPLKGNRWNYISYLPQVNMTVKDALAGYNASEEDVIKSQSGFAMYSVRNGWIGNLAYLEPGKGYMLYRKAAADTSFFYPGLNGNLTNHTLAANPSLLQGQALNEFETPVSGNFNYSGNMTITAVTDNDFRLQPGDTVLAFVAGQVVGKAVAMPVGIANQNILFFTIGGDQEQLVYFKVARRGAIILQSDTTITYQVNKKLGTLIQPVVLHFKEGRESNSPDGLYIYPNPFTSTTRIRVDIHDQSAAGQQIQLSIYDISGKLIRKLQDASVTGGRYETSWDGRTASGSDCKPGLYFIHITVNGLTRIYKVIKE